MIRLHVYWFSFHRHVRMTVIYFAGGVFASMSVSFPFAGMLGGVDQGRQKVLYSNYGTNTSFREPPEA